MSRQFADDSDIPPPPTRAPPPIPVDDVEKAGGQDEDRPDTAGTNTATLVAEASSMGKHEAAPVDDEVSPVGAPVDDKEPGDVSRMSIGGFFRSA